MKNTEYQFSINIDLKLIANVNAINFEEAVELIESMSASDLLKQTIIDISTINIISLD